MASSPRTIDYLLEQLGGAGAVSARKMFGDYAFYLDGVVVALVCDDGFYLKDTPAGRALVRSFAEAPPYPGARPHLRVDPADWEDADYFVALVRATKAALPPPKAPRSPALRVSNAKTKTIAKAKAKATPKPAPKVRAKTKVKTPASGGVRPGAKAAPRRSR